MRDAFRLSGRAAGVIQRAEIFTMRRSRVEFRRFAFNPVLISDAAFRCGIADHDNVFKELPFGLNFLYVRQQVLGDDQDTGAAVIENVCVFFWSERRAHAHGHTTDFHDAKERGYPFREIQRENADEVAHPDTEFLQGVADLIDFLADLPERHVSFQAVKRDLICAVGQIVLENIDAIVASRNIR